MKNLLRIGVPLIAFAALAVTAWVAASLQAQIAGAEHMLASAADLGIPPGESADHHPDSVPTTTVHLAAAPPTHAAARTWLRLSRSTDFSFTADTPLIDALDFLRKQSAEADPGVPGLAFYVDPVALQEHERTLTSPVLLELDGVSLAKGLTLLLAQLDLVFDVQEDGLVLVTSKDRDGHPEHPEALILDSLASLRSEVACLRQEVAALRVLGAIGPNPSVATTAVQGSRSRMRGAICGVGNIFCGR